MQNETTNTTRISALCERAIRATRIANAKYPGSDDKKWTQVFNEEMAKQSPHKNSAIWTKKKRYGQWKPKLKT